MNRIELKTICCKGVKSFVPFHKPSLSAAVSLVPDDSGDGGGGGGGGGRRRYDPKLFQTQRTPIDRENGENPEWDEAMRFDLGNENPIGGLFLEFELRNHGVLLGNNVVGSVRVPVAEIVAEQQPGSFHHISYQVRTPDDKPNGTLTFAYKMKDREIAIHSPSPVPAVYYPQPVPNMNPAMYCPPSESAPAYLPPLELNSFYPPPPERNSMYPPLPETGSIFPPPPSKSNSLYPHLPETDSIYPKPPDATFYNQLPTAPACPPTVDQGVAYPALAPPWGGYYPPPPSVPYGDYSLQKW